MTRIVRLPFLVLLLALGGCDMPAPPPLAPPKPVAAPALTLYAAAGTGDLARVEALLAGGADVNAADAEGLTPLHAAAFGGHADMIRLLAGRGARTDAQDAYGFTPLHAASRDGHLGAVEALVEAGADVNVQDAEGFTPHAMASLMHHAAIVDYLAAHGALREEIEVAVVEAPPPAVLLTGANFRAWTSRSGAQVEAEFVETVFDTVTLRKRDGNHVRINLALLTPADQVLARQLAGSVPPALVRSRAAGPGDARSDSIGLKVGRENGWTVLTGCQLLKRSGNDGDSFHVRHDGKEYIFRLYYVDTAETSMAFPARVKDQAAYFKISENQTLRIGEEAKKFSEKILSAGSFTVVTRWEDARGNSRLPRHYAFVITDQGDLDELLIAEGLVRLYGMRIDSGSGSRKYSALKRLEGDAKQARAGAWGIDRKSASAAR